MAGVIYQMQQIAITSSNSYVSFIKSCGIGADDAGYAATLPVTATVKFIADGDVQVGTSYAFSGDVIPDPGLSRWTQVPYPVAAGAPFELTYTSDPNYQGATDLCIYNPSATSVNVNFILLVH